MQLAFARSLYLTPPFHSTVEITSLNQILHKSFNDDTFGTEMCEKQNT